VVRGQTCDGGMAAEAATTLFYLCSNHGVNPLHTSLTNRSDYLVDRLRAFDLIA
jgi:hypothetical protein